MSIQFTKPIEDKEFFLELLNHIKVSHIDSGLTFFPFKSTLPLSLVSENLRTDSEIMDKSLRMNVGCYRIFSPKAKLDLNLAMMIVRKCPIMIRDLWDEYRKSPAIIIKAMSNTGLEDHFTHAEIIYGIAECVFEDFYKLSDLIRDSKENNWCGNCILIRVSEKIKNDPDFKARCQPSPRTMSIIPPPAGDLESTIWSL